MGVKGLNTLIKKYAPDAPVQVHLSHYALKKVAVDTSLFMFKYKVIFAERWMTAFINLVACFRRNNVHPVFIFDSKAPADKDDEKRKRQEKREKHQERIVQLETALALHKETGHIDQILLDVYKKVADEKVSLLAKRFNTETVFRADYVEEELERMRGKVVGISDDDFRILREMLDIMAVPCIQAPGEAEAFGSYLCCTGKVAAVLTEDTDVLAYGCPRFLSKLDTSSSMCTEINIGDLYRDMELSYPTFVDLCIMLGTDYNSNMKGIGPEKAYKLITEHGNLEAIEAKGYPVECLRYQRVRELFRFELKDDVQVRFCGTPDWAVLEAFVFRYNVRIHVGSLKKSFEFSDLEFEP